MSLTSILSPVFAVSLHSSCQKILHHFTSLFIYPIYFMLQTEFLWLDCKLLAEEAIIKSHNGESLQVRQKLQITEVAMRPDSNCPEYFYFSIKVQIQYLQEACKVDFLMIKFNKVRKLPKEVKLEGNIGSLKISESRCQLRLPVNKPFLNETQ